MSVRACGHSDANGMCCGGCYTEIQNQLSQEQARGRKYKEALGRIAKFTFQEGKTGDPLYLLEICQETAQAALAETGSDGTPTARK